MTRSPAHSGTSRETFWRSLQTLNVTRILIAVVLLVYLNYDGSGIGGRNVYADTCIAYLLLSVVFGMVTLYWRHRFLLQLGCQIAIDMLAISLLYLAAGGGRSGLGLLYLFPLAGAATLAPLALALFSASLATLFMLGESTYQIFIRGQEPPLMQAGIYGAALFAVVLVVSRMAARLIGQEELAARHEADLKIQQAINQIVIADVGDGILVVGRDGRVFTGNPAARQMLGLGGGSDSGFALADVEALGPVAGAFAAWRDTQAKGSVGATQAAYVTVKPYLASAPGAHGWRGRRDLPVHLKLRFARVDTPDEMAERSVIFLQDVSAIENQAQQLKLASMGRLTASIAHEVRNPLSAIGHATSLLAEDLNGPAEQRLLRIVSDNVARVNRMVEDILQLSRKVQPHSEPVLLKDFLVELKTEFDETHGLGSDIVWVGRTGAAAVRFDPLHLREVLINLMNNAIRYASRQPASIRVFGALDAAGHMELHVQDDGPGITPDVRAHLFEPFYTTSSKGTGLGLYLARELCLNNQGMLDYEVRFGDHRGASIAPSGRFVITFAQTAPA
jgi:two-component system sensor histidine kinase PilS (NtrC family)